MARAKVRNLSQTPNNAREDSYRTDIFLRRVGILCNFAAGMKKVSTTWYIHGFALLHAAATVLCSLAGVQDSLVLTALTMALAVIICRRENLTVELTVISLILVNILGFVLGSLVPQYLSEGLKPAFQHAITTFLVTELLGWALYGFAHTLISTAAAAYERRLSWRRNLGWLLVAIAFVFGFRVYIELANTGNLFEESGVAGILVTVTFASLTYMVVYAVKMQREASQQRTRRHQAEFSYMNLKNQVNPHFLFNSLNVLDAIVHEGTKEEASEYIHKMAAIYRYLMKVEGQRTVPLADELDFSRNYRDLIQIRFPEGLVFSSDEWQEEKGGFIVPCTLQLLIENAIKHNAISPENPLVIRLINDGKRIRVWNRRIPKIGPVNPSTGIGLQYIRNQYRDIADAEIEVEETADSFAVTVPILQETE